MEGPLRPGRRGKLTRVAFYIERYGSELEADFQQVYGLDLGQLVRARLWRRIASLVHQLPQASRLAQATANDPEHVEMILAAQQKDGPTPTYTPPLSEWGVAESLLADLVDSVQTLAAITIAVNSGKPPKTRPTPRPRTAFEDVRKAQARRDHERTLRRLRGGRVK